MKDTHETENLKNYHLNNNIYKNTKIRNKYSISFFERQNEVIHIIFK